MPGGTTVVELQGEGVLDELGPALDEIHTAIGAPVNARRPWLSAWIRTYRAYEPWAVTVRSGDGLAGAALLARRRHLTGTEVIGLGQGPSDYQRFAVRPEDAPALADAVAGALARLPSPWRLHVEQLPDGDPTAAELAHRLGAATVEPGDAAPRTRFGPDRSLTSFTSQGYRGEARRKQRKAEAEGYPVRLAFTRDPAEIAAALPAIGALRRRRDTAMSRIGPLDTAAGARFFRAAVDELAVRDEIEVVTLHLGDALAAYLVGLIDGGSFRSWDSRIDPAWLAYSPGTVLELALFERLLADPAMEEFDRMRGEEPYKMRTTNLVEPSCRLRAWSSPAVRSFDLAVTRSRDRLKQSERLRHAVQSVKRRLAR